MDAMSLSCIKFQDFQLEALKRKATLLPRFEKYCTEKNYSFRAPIEEIYDYSVLEYSFALWQWGTPISSIPATTASDDEIFSHLLAISEPGYFTVNWDTMVMTSNRSNNISPSSPVKTICTV